VGMTGLGRPLRINCGAAAPSPSADSSERPPGNFSEGPGNLSGGSGNFSEGPRNLSDGSGNFSEGPRNLSEGSGNFPRVPENLFFP